MLEKLRTVDAMAMAAGDLSQRSLLMRDGLPADTTMEELPALGGVGDVLGRVIDAQGRPVDHPINVRVIGIGLADLAKIPNVIVAAGGTYKVPVIRTLLGLGHINTFVKDEATAHDLLAKPALRACVTGKWDASLCALVGWNPHHLPHLLASWDRAGTLRWHLAAR